MPGLNNTTRVAMTNQIHRQMSQDQYLSLTWDLELRQWTEPNLGLRVVHGSETYLEFDTPVQATAFVLRYG